MILMKNTNFEQMRLFLSTLAVLVLIGSSAQTISVSDAKEAIKGTIKSKKWLESIDETSFVYSKTISDDNAIALIKILRLKTDDEIKEVKRTGQFLMEKNGDDSKIIAFLEYAPIESFDFLGEIKTRANSFIIFYQIDEEGITYYIRDSDNGRWFKTDRFQENIRLDYLNIDPKNLLVVYYLGDTQNIKEGTLIEIIFE